MPTSASGRTWWWPGADEPGLMRLWSLSAKAVQNPVQLEGGATCPAGYQTGHVTGALPNKHGSREAGVLTAGSLRVGYDLPSSRANSRRGDPSSGLPSALRKTSLVAPGWGTASPLMRIPEWASSKLEVLLPQPGGFEPSAQVPFRFKHQDSIHDPALQRSREGRLGSRPPNWAGLPVRGQAGGEGGPLHRRRSARLSVATHGFAFSCDIAYSESPAAWRASPRSVKTCICGTSATGGANIA